MREALDLARRGRGAVEPNPRVGALAIRDGVVIGRGWHRAWGGPHAEAAALADAASRGDATPDTVVVTLEPCSAEPGQDGKRQPPCTRALLDAGVRRVVVGATDDDPRHGGRGLDRLRSAGVRVDVGVLAEECAALNPGFARWLGSDRPWTIAKWAMTLDGKLAAATGDSKWISGSESRRRVHALRAAVDAVVVGYRTALRDDPKLTARDVEPPVPADRQPLRILVDPCAALPMDRHLLSAAAAQPTLVVVRDDVDADAHRRLAAAGAAVLTAPSDGTDHGLQIDVAWRALRARGLRRVLVEGGGGLLGQLWQADCVDQVRAWVAPRLVGGGAAPTPFDGVGFDSVGAGPRLVEFWAETCGEDLELHGVLGP